MGKAGRWLRSFLAGGKKGGKKGEAMAAALPGEAAKEKRWSFRRPVHGEKAAAEAAAAADGVVVGEAEAGFDLSASESEFDQKSTPWRSRWRPRPPPTPPWPRRTPRPPPSASPPARRTSCRRAPSRRRRLSGFRPPSEATW